jgi:ribosomal protein S18 acetylase RimI-like enzyme
MIFRPYSPEDFDALYGIEVLCFKPPLRFGRWYMRDLLQRRNAAAWIAEEGGRVAGFAIVEWTEGETGLTAYVQTIEVAPEARSRGIGRALLARVEGSALHAGADPIWLHVDEQNSVAQRLYKAQGYSARDRVEDYYAQGRAALVYSKSLAQVRGRKREGGGDAVGDRKA